MKKNILARTVIALGLPLLLMMNPANADFTGYVVQMYSGTGNFSTNFDSALVGFSSTPTGAVGLYILTGDKTYASMLSNIRVHQQRVRVSHSGGLVDSIILDNP